MTSTQDFFDSISVEDIQKAMSAWKRVDMTEANDVREYGAPFINAFTDFYKNSEGASNQQEMDKLYDEWLKLQEDDPILSAEKTVDEIMSGTLNLGFGDVQVPIKTGLYICSRRPVFHGIA